VLLAQLPLSGHQPTFFHPKDGKDNGFLSISSKLLTGFFSESIHNQMNDNLHAKQHKTKQRNIEQHRAT
jgi:hypothetical protein